MSTAFISNPFPLCSCLTLSAHGVCDMCYGLFQWHRQAVRPIIASFWRRPTPSWLRSKRTSMTWRKTVQGLRAILLLLQRRTRPRPWPRTKTQVRLDMSTAFKSNPFPLCSCLTLSAHGVCDMCYGLFQTLRKTPAARRVSVAAPAPATPPSNLTRRHHCQMPC
jgi:hypothetical protein